MKKQYTAALLAAVMTVGISFHLLRASGNGRT